MRLHDFPLLQLADPYQRASSRATNLEQHRRVTKFNPYSFSFGVNLLCCEPNVSFSRLPSP